MDGAPRTKRAGRRPKVQRRKKRMAELLAEKIEADIIAAGWPVGSVLASENELVERYGVSRAVFREAMRIVDHHGVAQMRRGPGGGLVVLEPDLDAAVRAVSLNLNYIGINPLQINEARLALELSCVRTATMKIDDDARTRLNDHIEAESAVLAAGSDAEPPEVSFHVLIAELTKNPALRVFVEILSRIAPLDSEGDDDAAARKAMTPEKVHDVHRRIAHAMMRGDADAAERRMRPHLQSQVGYVRPIERSPDDVPEDLRPRTRTGKTL